jgi:propanol-preferring alcohol dehydrogenase
MKAMAVFNQAPIESAPLRAVELETPRPGPGEILVRVSTCGVCRTDLHVVEGDLPARRPRTVPGHEVVGVVERLGEGCKRFVPGARVGIAWLRETCGQCGWCRSERENLCPQARFTGYDEDGGYAEMAVVREDFAYALPDGLSDRQLAPLLCAGIIGFRALKRAQVRPGITLGLYGFGGSAHIALQVAKYWGCRVFVMSRAASHRDLARTLGADWIGGPQEKPPAELDAAILFAPAGELALPALASLAPAGVLAIAGIHLTDIPALNYARHLFKEKELRSVTANTRADGEEFLTLAEKIPVRTETVPFPLAQANQALNLLKHDQIKGAAVLSVAG